MSLSPLIEIRLSTIILIQSERYTSYKIILLTIRSSTQIIALKLSPLIETRLSTIILIQSERYTSYKIILLTIRSSTQIIKSK